MITLNFSFITKLISCLVMMLWLLNLNSQSIYNLVPNYSFETTLSCIPNGINNAYKWHSTSTSSFKTLEYSNSCFQNSCCGVPYNIFNYGFQYPRTGNAYAAAFFLYNNNIHRGYLQTELLDSLKLGSCYYVEFFVNLVNVSNFAINNIAMAITKFQLSQGNNDSVIQTTPHIIQYLNPILPKDTINWIKISGIYKASGGEKYITIGNFKNDASTDTSNTNFPTAFKYGQYYVEDVSVIPLDSIFMRADAGSDITITTGDSVFIGSLLGGTITTTWYNSAGNTIATNVPGLYVSPIQNTFYVLEQNFCTYSSRDTVYVTVTALPVKLLSFAARKQDKNNLLTWRTSTEQNNRGFELQRSTNPANTGTGGKRFSTIAFVPTKAANGTSTTVLKYDYVDKKPPAAGSYYRLKQTDFDGKYTFTNVVFIKGDPETVLVLASLYPNPTHQILNAILQSPKAQTIRLIISDAAGKVVLQHNLQLQKGENNKTINALALAKGAYIVKVITDGGEAVISKFVKE